MAQGGYRARGLGGGEHRAKLPKIKLSLITKTKKILLRVSYAVSIACSTKLVAYLFILSTGPPNSDIYKNVYLLNMWFSA
jgi:hypothetical protein